MTVEKERYTGFIIRRAKNALYSEAIVSLGMISLAMLVLVKIV